MQISLREVEQLMRTGSVEARAADAPAPFGLDNLTATPTPAAISDISERAQELRQVTKKIQALPEVREDLVAEIKAQIEAGTYNVSSDDIADLMLRRAYADRIR